MVFQILQWSLPAFAAIGVHPYLLCGADANVTARPLSWLKVLGDGKRAIFRSTVYAQCATAFLHGLQPEMKDV
jgi:antirestriction protein ArdC